MNRKLGMVSFFISIVLFSYLILIEAATWTFQIYGGKILWFNPYALVQEDIFFQVTPMSQILRTAFILISIAYFLNMGRIKLKQTKEAK